MMTRLQEGSLQMSDDHARGLSIDALQAGADGV